MPRPSGTWTFDGESRRYRNAAGQFIPDAAVLGTANALRVTADDAHELRHRVPSAGPGGTTRIVDHTAGAATAEWLRQMQQGLRQPCMTCGVMVGLADLEITSQHSRDWSKHR